MNYDYLAQQFTEYYYTQFDNDRAALKSLYRDNSMLSFEGDQIKGAEAIAEKLKSLPFAKVKHQVSTLDIQPGMAGNDITVLVTGLLKVDDEPNPMRYCQAFHLIPEGQSYYVFNDIFRLNYA